MELLSQILYYVFVALALGGALGVVLSRGGLNSAMSMLVAMIGMSGMLFVMKAFLLAFVMLMVYAGAVMVLFVFIMMLVGEERENLSMKRRVLSVVLWSLFCGACAVFGRLMPELADGKVVSQNPISSLNAYGILMFSDYISILEITGVVLLVAMVGVIVIAKDPSPKRPKREML